MLLNFVLDGDQGRLYTLSFDVPITDRRYVETMMAEIGPFWVAPEFPSESEPAENEVLTIGHLIRDWREAFPDKPLPPALQVDTLDDVSHTSLEQSWITEIVAKYGGKPITQFATIVWGHDEDALQFFGRD